MLNVFLDAYEGSSMILILFCMHQLACIMRLTIDVVASSRVSYVVGVSEYSAVAIHVP